MLQESTSLLSSWRSLFALCLMVALWYPGTLAQSMEEMMGVKEGHCSMAQGTVDGKTFACMVWDHDPAKFSDPTQIEVYRRHKRICTIEPGSPIREWHFWREGKELAVYYGTKDGLGTYALYKARSGRQVDRPPHDPTASSKRATSSVENTRASSSQITRSRLASPAVRANVFTPASFYIFVAPCHDLVSVGHSRIRELATRPNRE